MSSSLRSQCEKTTDFHVLYTTPANDGVQLFSRDSKDNGGDDVM